MQIFDVIILGGGAAGLMCAIEAGKRGRRVVVLERADRIGKKILISGGGRCNFTNLNTGPENFPSPESALGQAGFGGVHPISLCVPRRKTRNPKPEKKARPIV